MNKNHEHTRQDFEPGRELDGLHAPMGPTRPNTAEVADELKSLAKSWTQRSRRSRQRVWDRLAEDQPALGHLDPHNLALMSSSQADVVAMIALLSIAQADAEAVTVLIAGTLPYWMTVCTRHHLDVTALVLAIRGIDASTPGLMDRPLLVIASAARREVSRESHRVLMRTAAHSASAASAGWSVLGQRRRPSEHVAPEKVHVPEIPWMNLQARNLRSCDDQLIAAEAASELLDELGPYLPDDPYDDVAIVAAWSEPAPYRAKIQTQTAVSTQTARRRRKAIGTCITQRHGITRQDTKVCAAA